MKQIGAQGKHFKHVSRVRLAATAVAALLVVACGGGGDDPTERAMAQGSSASCGNRVNNTFEKLLECVTLDGVRSHQAALQAIADANGGVRAAGTPSGAGQHVGAESAYHFSSVGSRQLDEVVAA